MQKQTVNSRSKCASESRALQDEPDRRSFTDFLDCGSLAQAVIHASVRRARVIYQ